VNKENLAMGGKVVLRSRCRSQNPNATSRRIEMTSRVGTSDVNLLAFNARGMWRKEEKKTNKE
jgi:hypothetical protein